VVGPGGGGPKKFLSKKFLFPALACIFAFVLLFSFVKNHVSCVGGFPVFKKAQKEEPQKQLAELPVPVKVYKLARVSFRDTLPSLGTIRGFREYAMRFATSGTVEYINFKEGERITQGDIIASLDQREALLKLEYAKIEMDKQAKLFELGSVTETRLKQSQLEYQSAKTELDKTNLVAVSDGYIGGIEVDKGFYVTPQDKVCTFVDVKDVYIEFGVIEKDIDKIKEGQNVEITVETYPDQIFKGKVDSVSPMVEGRSRTVKVRSKLSNVDEKIKPGMFGRVNVLVYEKDQALVIPSSSFKKKEDQHFVYLVHLEEPKEDAAPEAAAFEPAAAGKKAKKGKRERVVEAPVEEEPQATMGTVEIRNIELNYATPDAIEVKEGLEEGDLVIVDVEQELQDKAKVEITETQEGIF
jgi:membrane fusion protein, multidrug efflux system